MRSPVTACTGPPKSLRSASACFAVRVGSFFCASATTASISCGVQRGSDTSFPAVCGSSRDAIYSFPAAITFASCASVNGHSRKIR